MIRNAWSIGSTSALELLEHAPAALLATTAEGYLRFANQRALDLFGHTASDLHEHSIDHLIAPSARATRAELWQRYQAAPGPHEDVRLRGLHRDGSELDLRISLGHAHVDGALIVLASLQRDRGSLDEDVAALQARLERMESIVQHVPLALYDTRTHGDFGATFISDGVQQILGHAPQDFLHDPEFWLKHVHPDDHHSVFEGLGKGFESGRHGFTYRFLHQDGHYRWVQDTFRLVRDQDGTPRRIVGCWIDITERKAAEETIKTAEARTRALLRAIPDLMFRMDKDGQYLDYKAEGPDDLLVAADQVIGTNLRDLPMPPALIERFMTAIQHVIETGETVTMEYDLDFAGAPCRYEARMSKSNPDEIVAIVRDITDRTRSEKRIKELNRRLALRNRDLQAANRELESFSYSVSHDLRAPLRAIDGFSMLLQDKHEDALSEDARNLLDRVRAAAGRMGQIIEDMLCLSRISRGALSCQQVDLSTLAADVIESLRAGQPASQPRRHVDVIIAPDISGYGDPSLLRILLENMLGNAWKYTSHRERARIELGTMRQDGALVYFVRDNGAGFDMKYASKLFGPFQRLHTADEFPGNGIGLATAARIVHRHGGRIWADAAVGQGAVFYFTLDTEDGE